MTCPEAVCVVDAHLHPPDIGYLTMLFESYEGLAIVRTLDPRAGRVAFWVPASRRADFLAAAAALEGEVALVLDGEHAWTPEDAP